MDGDPFSRTTGSGLQGDSSVFTPLLGDFPACFGVIVVITFGGTLTKLKGFCV